MGLCALIGASTACLGTSESLLETGQAIDSGHKRYDSFFDEVGTLRDEVEDFDADLFPVREPLTDVMELDVDISMSGLLEKVKKRAVKFRDFGVTMSLRLTPDAKLLTVRGKLDVDSKDEQVLGAIEESGLRAVKTFRELGAQMTLAAKLNAERRILVEQVEKLDPADPNRELIEDELAAASRVLDAAQRKLLASSRTLALYLISLSDAVDTGAAEAKDTQCEDALAGKKPPKKPRGPRRPPPPPRPGGDDFEM